MFSETVARVTGPRPLAPVAQTGKSARLLSEGSQVRVLPGAPLSKRVRGASTPRTQQPRHTR